MADREPKQLGSLLRQATKHLAASGDLDPLMARIGDARVVMLGEASHGTSEFYTWRHRISERLIRERGFNFIAVEGDWPDCYAVNRYVKRRPHSGENARQVLHHFERWPSWMWANHEVIDLVEMLRAYNDGLPEPQQVGFFGLDVYSLWQSINAVVEYLERIDPELAQSARGAYSCFDPYYEDEQEYARATALVPTSCEDETSAILAELRRNAPAYTEDGREAFFNAEQNALVARNAEIYYRTMVRGGPGSWNVRDTHMMETLERLLKAHGPDARAIVWAHNTHIGDARATDMARSGMINLGQLARERWGPFDVALVGFASYSGSVIAGAQWGAPMKRMALPPARDGSWEALLHEAVGTDALLLTSELSGVPEAERAIAHRAVGVVYDPDKERWGNYVPTVLPQRYDALLYFDESRALAPLHMPTDGSNGVPDTYPSGM